MLGLLLTTSIFGCALPTEREALRPLPEKGAVLSYQEMIARARFQTAAALEAFYADNWLEMEQTAQVLEQTARHLPQSSEQPRNVQAVLVKESDEMRQQAVRLGEAARAKNVQNAIETLQRMHLTLRTLRPVD